MLLGNRKAHVCALVFCILLLAACAKERPVKSVLPQGRRIPKSALTGQFVYLSSAVEAEYTSERSGIAPGLYLENDKLVQFELSENTLDIVAMDPLYLQAGEAQRNRILASYPVRHVDVLRKQNADGENTHEEEETDSRRPWRERQFVVVDIAQNRLEAQKNVKSAVPSDSIVIDPATRGITFHVRKHLQDDTLLTERVSLLPYDPSASFEQREYPKTLQQRFGYFKTTTYKLDRYGRPTQNLQKDFINRWDISKKIVFHLSKGFPQHLKPSVEKVFSAWNRVFETTIGVSPLEWRENSGQEPGHLTSNLIVYDRSRMNHGLLGYGPTVTNPRTGQILKADVFIYGGTLQRALYNERKWGELLGDPPNEEEIRAVPSGTVSDSLRSPELENLGSLDLLFLQRFERAFVDTRTVTQTLSGLFPAYVDRSTTLSTDYVSEIARERRANALSDEALEILIFTPLLAHELGHALGLSHNFMGSADHEHFQEGHRTASVMDYPLLAYRQLEGPGSYDSAAIKVAYGRDPAETERLLQERFLFCSDRDTFSSRLGLCQQFDSGVTLTESVSSSLRRYSSSYFFNNLRNDRTEFAAEDRAYELRVLAYLYPLRMTFDHANAIAEVGKAIAKDTTAPAPTERELVPLWQLLRQRIEATPRSSKRIEITLQPGEKVMVDPDRVRTAVQDAREARQLAYQALSSVVLEDRRPLYPQVDMFRDTVRRGVLYDKMIALRLVGLRTSHPLGSSVGMTMFEGLHEDVGRLFSMVLSNSQSVRTPTGEVQYAFRIFDPNLRESLLSQLSRSMATLSLESGELREMLRLQRVDANDPDRAALQKSDEIRANYRNYLVEMEQNPSPVRRAELALLLSGARTDLNNIPVAAAEIRTGDRLKAPVRLAEFGRLESVTGHLVRDNLNVMEDRLNAALRLITWTEDQLRQASLERRRVLEEQRRNLESLSLAFTRYLRTERALIERLYGLYLSQDRH